MLSASPTYLGKVPVSVSIVQYLCHIGVENSINVLIGKIVTYIVLPE